jgi:phosphoribosylaminoimidazole-succinocarboxamide synthase
MERILDLEALAPYQIRRGKVRDLYCVPGYREDELMLMCVSDRASVGNRVVGEIEGKGPVLHSITLAMKRLTGGIVPNDILVIDEKEILDYYGYSEMDPSLKGRLCIVKGAAVIPFECIVRGKIRGSLYDLYAAHLCAPGDYLGHQLPGGMKAGDSFSVPLFTPSTKVSNGDDENIIYEKMVELLQEWLDENDIDEWTGVGLAQAIRSTSLALFMAIGSFLRVRGIELEDTKFEFGLVLDYPEDDKDEPRWVLTLLDEVGTPDSSRMVKDGQDISKQFLRNLIKKYGWSGITDEQKAQFLKNYAAVEEAATQ